MPPLTSYVRSGPPPQLMQLLQQQQQPQGGGGANFLGQLIGGAGESAANVLQSYYDEPRAAATRGLEAASVMAPILAAQTSQATDVAKLKETERGTKAAEERKVGLEQAVALRGQGKEWNEILATVPTFHPADFKDLAAAEGSGISSDIAQETAARKNMVGQLRGYLAVSPKKQTGDMRLAVATILRDVGLPDVADEVAAHTTHDPELVKRLKILADVEQPPDLTVLSEGARLAATTPGGGTDIVAHGAAKERAERRVRRIDINTGESYVIDMWVPDFRQADPFSVGKRPNDFEIPALTAVDSTQFSLITQADDAVAALRLLKDKLEGFEKTGIKQVWQVAIPDMLHPGWLEWGTDAKKNNAVIRYARQIIGKAKEGGVLRKEDEIKYEKMLVSIGDKPAVASDKMEYIIREMEMDFARKINLLEAADKNIQGFLDMGYGGTPYVEVAAYGPDGQILNTKWMRNRPTDPDEAQDSRLLEQLQHTQDNGVTFGILDDRQRRSVQREWDRKLLHPLAALTSKDFDSQGRYIGLGPLQMR